MLQTFPEPATCIFFVKHIDDDIKICVYHLRQHVPVVAVDFWREVVHTEHVVCTVGQDAGTVRGPSLECKDGVC